MHTFLSLTKVERKKNLVFLPELSAEAEGGGVKNIYFK
jgi:hypothetical protein